MILNKDQAKAVANAMAELNNVYALADIYIPDGDGAISSVRPMADGGVRVFRSSNGLDFYSEAEVYASQNAFMAAYGVE